MMMLHLTEKAKTWRHIARFAFFLGIVFSTAASTSFAKTDATVAARTICNAVRSHIETHSPWTAEQLTIRTIRWKRDIGVPNGKVNIRVSAPKHTDWLGPIPFSVGIVVGNKQVRRITVPATIEVWSNVILAAKPLGRGQTITADAVKVERMNLARVPSAALLSKDRAIGCRVSRSIAANTILRSDQIELPRIVKRGDVVQVVAQSPSLTISVKGVAKESGALGDHIRVQNTRSKRIIHALVVDDRTVHVEY